MIWASPNGVLAKGNIEMVRMKWYPGLYGYDRPQQYLQTAKILRTHSGIKFNQFFHAISMVPARSNVSRLISILVDPMNVAKILRQYGPNYSRLIKSDRYVKFAHD